MDDKKLEGFDWQDSLARSQRLSEQTQRHIDEMEAFLLEQERLRKSREELRQIETQNEFREIAVLQADNDLARKKLAAVELATLNRMIERRPKPRSSATSGNTRKVTTQPQKLPAKTMDHSRYFDEANLTDRQREVASLRLEYGLPVIQIAKRLGISRPAVDKAFLRATNKMEKSGSLHRARKRQAAHRSSDDQ
jgi:DNA-binding NarL/FixJ family response regulator